VADREQFAIGLQPPNGPPGPVSGNPNQAKKHSQYRQGDAEELSR